MADNCNGAPEGGASCDPTEFGNRKQIKGGFANESITHREHTVGKNLENVPTVKGTTSKRTPTRRVK